MSKALSQAARLKPEIRLAQALSQFSASLPEPRVREFKLLQTKSPPDSHDIIRLTEEINRDGSRAHKSWRPYATSMSLFLERIQTLSRVGDFLVGSSQNLIASGVWATVKMTLGVSVASLLFFKRLSELFLKIGKSSAITQDIVAIFPASKELQDHMCEYLITLVSFCSKVIRALEKTTILQLSSPFIGFFDKEASEFQKDLVHWSDAISTKASVLLTRQQVDTADAVAKITRTLALSLLPEKKRNDLMLRSRHLQDRLCSWQKERVAAWRRQRKKGTATWIFEEATYKDWKSSSSSSFLWVQGKLGSGKTVLLANIVAELHTPPARQRDEQEGANPVTAYFFCNHDRHDSNTYENIMGSIFQQIISHLEPDSLSFSKLGDYLGQTPFPQLDTEAISALTQSLPRDKPTFIILDAIDECEETVAIEVLEGIRSIFESCTLHFCCSTRTPAPISGFIQSTFTARRLISMSSDPVMADMKTFVEAEFERRRHIRNLDRSLEDIIKEVLISASEGMYLWLSLQIDVLFPLQNRTLLSASDITRLLENPPRGLSEAFNRSLGRISDRRYGKAIFQLVAAAQRPLTLTELRIALLVEPGNTTWNPASLPYDEMGIVALCGGGLLEVDEEDDTVRFIHDSVYQHFQNGAKLRGQLEDSTGDYFFLEGEADVHFGMVCVTYLCYGIFNTALTTQSRVFLDANALTNPVSQATGSDLASKIITAIKGRRSRTQQNVDIGQLLQRYMTPPVNMTEILALYNYAQEHWIWHTARFCPNLCGATYKLFLKLLNNPPDHIIVPWGPSSGNPIHKWGEENCHFGVFLASLSSSAVSVDIEIHGALLSVIHGRANSSPRQVHMVKPAAVMQEVAALTARQFRFLQMSTESRRWLRRLVVSGKFPSGPEEPAGRGDVLTEGDASPPLMLTTGTQPSSSLIYKLGMELIRCQLANEILPINIFLPRNIVDGMVTKDLITAKLPFSNRIYDRWTDSLASQIHSQARKVFAVLTLIGEESAIVALYKEGITDQDLPLDGQQSGRSILVFRNHSDLKQKTFESFQTWSRTAVWSFLEKQWYVLAPLIDTTGADLKLHPNCPLPISDSFLLAKDENIFIYRSRLHPEHVLGAPGSNHGQLVVIKEIEYHDAIFHRERNNLRTIEGLKHRHLIKLFASCEMGQLYYLIFPWAAGGNLRDFWKRRDKAPRTQDLVLWSLEQFFGLIDAVWAVHEVSILHGDIGPHNILHFTDPGTRGYGRRGTLVLAGFACSEYDRSLVGSRNADTTALLAKFDPYYETPEAEDDCKNGKSRSQSYDMWCTGCLLLDHIIWLLYGFDAVETFRKRRTSYRRNPPDLLDRVDFKQVTKFFANTEVHPQVHKALSHLSQDPRCGDGTALGDVLDLIDHRLLRIEAKQRVIAQELQSQILEIVIKARGEPSYLFKDFPADAPRTIPEFFLQSPPLERDAPLQPPKFSHPSQPSYP